MKVLIINKSLDIFLGIAFVRLIEFIRFVAEVVDKFFKRN